MEAATFISAEAEAVEHINTHEITLTAATSTTAVSDSSTSSLNPGTRHKLTNGSANWKRLLSFTRMLASLWWRALILSRWRNLMRQACGRQLLDPPKDSAKCGNRPTRSVILIRTQFSLFSPLTRAVATRGLQGWLVVLMLSLNLICSDGTNLPSNIMITLQWSGKLNSFFIHSDI